MNAIELIQALILQPCPEPSRVAIEHRQVGTKHFITIRPSHANVTRIVGRSGRTIAALTLLAGALCPEAKLNLMDADNIPEQQHPETTPAQIFEAIAKALNIRATSKTEDNTTFATVEDIPETLRLALTTVFHNASRHPTAPLFLQ